MGGSHGAMVGPMAQGLRKEGCLGLRVPGLTGPWLLLQEMKIETNIYKAAVTWKTNVKVWFVCLFFNENIYKTYHFKCTAV